MSRRRAQAWVLGVAGLVVLGAAGCTDDDPAPERTTQPSDPEGSASESPTSDPAVADVCAALDPAVLERLVPAGSATFDPGPSTSLPQRTCTVDNELAAEQNRLVRVTVEDYPPEMEDGLPDELADRCEQLPAEVTAAGTCAGATAGEGEVRALDGGTLVLVSYTTAPDLTVTDDELADLEQLASQALAGS